MSKQKSSPIVSSIAETMRQSGIITMHNYPPNNTNISTLGVPTPSKNQHVGYTSRCGIPPTPQQEFNWMDRNQVVKLRYGGKDPGSSITNFIINKSPNQYSCGSCWAVSAAFMTADRFAIWSLTNPVPLSAPFIVACMQSKTPGLDSNACCDGLSESAFTFINKIGLIPDSEFPLENSTMQASEGSPCQNENVYTDANLAKCSLQPVVRALDNSFSTLLGSNAAETIQLIKDSIFAFGPVVGCFKVYSDFQTKTTTFGGNSMWAETNNVYIHGKYPTDGSRMLGGHAIVIVGYGVEKNVPGFSQPVPYWIVRNSWSPQWNQGGTLSSGVQNPGGFCKIAMQVTIDGQTLNADVGLDQPAEGGAGGVRTWFPAVDDGNGGSLLCPKSVGGAAPSPPPSTPPSPPPSPDDDTPSPPPPQPGPQPLPLSPAQPVQPDDDSSSSSSFLFSINAVYVLVAVVLVAIFIYSARRR